MADSQADSVITSVISDKHDLPLDFDVLIDATEHQRIMRLVASAEDDGSVTTLSAFNSSI